MSKIIVNGVDISQCDLYLGDDVRDKCKDFSCTANPNYKYKQLKRKEQALDEIKKIVKQTCIQRYTNDCLGTRKHCGYGAVLGIINKAKDSK